MKRILMISLFLLLTACSRETTLSTLADPVPDQERNASNNGISLILEDIIFDDSPTHINTIVQNHSKRDYQYGEFYHIEVNKEGYWYIITYSNAVFLKNRRFIDTGSILPAGEEVRQVFSIEDLGVTLPAGEYRLVKTLLAKDGPYEELSVAVLFTVEY